MSLCTSIRVRGSETAFERISLAQRLIVKLVEREAGRGEVISMPSDIC